MTWATLLVLRDAVFPPSLDPTNNTSVMDHCYPSLQRILDAIDSALVGHVRELHVLHDGAGDHPLVYLQHLKIEAPVKSPERTLRAGWTGVSMKVVTHSGTLPVGRGESDWAVAVDVELATASASQLGALPPRPLWRQYFPSSSKPFQHRVSLSNPITAALVADAFVPVGSKDKVVIEIFPGPGQLTRALIDLPRDRISKIIVLEAAETYLRYLKPLEALDHRVTVVPIAGESWASYQTLQDMKLLDDVHTMPWSEGVHPQLHFISHLAANVQGEQLISQLFRSIPDQQWLFKYGRIPMSILLSEYVWKRVAGDHLFIRCKLSMIAAAVASCKEAVPYSTLQPYADHFHPVPSASAQAQRAKEKEQERPLMIGKPGNPFVAINIEPLKHQAIRPGLLDKWDYCLRHLYVNRATPIKNALPYLAPNAQSLLKKLTAPDLDANHRINPKTPVREMSVQDWSLLVQAFDEWPFAPEDLSITDTIGIDDEKHG